MFDPRFVDFSAGVDYLSLCGLPILVDVDDYEGIHIAVENLAVDIEKVTGTKPETWTDTDKSEVDGMIVVGSLEKSRFARELAETGGSKADTIRGKWECFATNVQQSPWHCAKRLLAITGSDKRGTIFGVYTLSEQIGVSPWYWWADVPIQTRDHIFALPVATSHGEPSVRYRGIFINDEAPALTDWVHENFGTCFNSKFYVKVFELLLRMKANFLWPAMWSGYPWPGSSFFVDDVLNQQLADRHGIVISTSHHEPMHRSTTEWRRAPKGPYSWDENKDSLTEFFNTGAKRAHPYESVLTLGMRGVGDDEIDAIDAQATMKNVIDGQRDIIEKVYGMPDGVQQVLALYKEVQEQYDRGLEIADDVTLLFADDNFGNLRRLPSSKERGRRGGFGIYYHLEYVGHPRSYKWLNSNSCAKIHQQLRLAHDNAVSQIWVFNVGDIKPMELPLTFALALAWDINSITPTSLPVFFDSYSNREFGPNHTKEIADLLLGHDRLMGLRRHEHIEPDTFSILHHREAETVLQRYQDIEARANSLLNLLPDPQKAAFFQVVLHPIKASRINTELRISQAKNQLYGLQRRNTTNALAQRVLDLFDEDFELSQEYHNSPWVGKKWNHIVKQPHYGYTGETWHAPTRDLITGLSYVQRRQDSTRIAGQLGIAVEGHAGIRPGLACEEIDRTHPSRHELVVGLTLPTTNPYDYASHYFEIYSRGSCVLEWTVNVSETWIVVSRTAGRSSPVDTNDHRIEITIDWANVPQDFQGTVEIEVQSDGGDYEIVHLPIDNRRVPSDFSGFVQSEGCVSIEVGRLSLTECQRQFYQHLPFLGRTGQGGIQRSEAAMDDIPSLEYSFFTFSAVSEIVLHLFFTMAIEVDEDHPLLYDISVDDLVRTEVPLLESKSKGALPEAWSTAVQDGVWTRRHTFPINTSGSHTVRYRPLVARLILEKIVVDIGGIPQSYLGPPPSYQSCKEKRRSQYHSIT